ncbi:hypothetical protein N0V95_007138 [Ascochyta clinopodiicola]|nr:hypothetical protein N0V95_007138 [Ascochyta clinopodiicola]
MRPQQSGPGALYAPYGCAAAPSGDAGVAAGGYVALVEQPVQRVRAVMAPTGVPAPAPAPAPVPVPVPASVEPVPGGIPAGSVPVSNPVIDLTGEESAGVITPAPNSTAAAAEDKVASEVLPASIHPAPAGPSAWTKGKRYLDKELASGSDSSRLFESMKTLSSAQRNRYCAAHWPTEQAAHDNIHQMSRLFLDADEMLMYARRWDGVAALPDLGEPSEEKRLERIRLLSEVEVDKRRLEQELPAKRAAKRAKEELGQWSNLVSNMKGPTFLAAFGRKKSEDSVKEVVREKKEELAKEQLAVAAGKKRKSGLAAAKRSHKKIRTETAAQSEPISSAASIPACVLAAEPARDLEVDLDAEGETDGEVDDLTQMIMDEFGEEEPVADDSATPALATQEEPEIPPLSPSAFKADLRFFEKQDSPQEKVSEQVTAPISILSLASREENTVSKIEEKVKKDLEALFENEATSEHVTAPSPTAISPREENTVVEEATSSEQDLDDLFGDNEEVSEQDTAPTSPLAAPQEDSMVAVGEDDVDDPFEENEEVPEQEISPTAESAPAELATPATADWELIEAGIHYAAMLSKAQAEITALEKSITNGVTHRNLLFRAARAKKSRPANEAKLRALKDEYKVLEQLSKEEVSQMWEEASAEAIQRRRQYDAGKAAKPAPRRKETGSCGGSKRS